MAEDEKIKFEMNTLEQMHEILMKFASGLEKDGFSKDDAFKVRLVSTELVSNVISHGHDTAEFECAVSPSKIVVSVTARSQEEIAFESVDLPGDVFSSRGRGMYLIRRYASDVVREGMTVTASIKVETEEKCEK